MVGLRAYEFDRESAGQSSGSLDQLIDTVALNHDVKAITVLCHSMCCLHTPDALLSRSMRTGKIGAKVKNVLLVAPAADASNTRKHLN